LIFELNDQYIKAKILRCNDSGESKALEDECKSKGLAIMMFQTLYGRIQAMLNRAELQKEIRSVTWAECRLTATFYSNI
jgi:hypothetical protein